MTNLKVRFLPEGGFDKNGAFIEYEGDAPSGKEPQFQRQGYLTLDLVCDEIRLGTNVGIVSEFEAATDRKIRRWLGAKGTIQPARWGVYSLSFLGEHTATQEISISIHEGSESEAVTLSGINMDGDLDIEGHHYFFLEIHLQKERFNKLVSELSAPGSSLRMSVRSDRFRDFYAEWSPSISEGRIIKFLNDKRDIENAEEIPENFWRTPEFQRELVSDPQSPPLTISVIRTLQPIFNDLESALHAEVEMDQPKQNFQPLPIPPPVPNPIPALEEISKRLRTAAFWVSLWLALICVILLYQT